MEVSSTKVYTIPEGTVVLKEGEINMDMYKILKGHAEIYRGYQTKNETLLGLLKPGAFFGEVGLLTGKPSIYTVVAYDDLYIYRIPVTDMSNYIKENPGDALAIMKNMANTMYNLKFDIDLLSKEKTIDVDQIAKRLLKYNMSMKADSGKDTTK